MKKILLPTDFSSNSWNAISYALNVFKDEKCVFYLLNTYTPIIYNIEHVLIASPQANVEKIVREKSLKGLDEIEARIEKEFNNPRHTISKIASFNNLISEINKLHEGNVMDFIIMGTKGATGAKEILLGSNTIHVFESAKCPVLAVPDGFSFETPHEILFPSDYGINFKTEQIKPIVNIAKQYHSRVNILHVSYGEDLTEAQEKNRKNLEVFFKDSAYLFHDVKNKNISQAINDFQLKARINLLVMVNNKHSFFENLFFKNKINKIGLHLNIPFLVIPAK